MFCFCHSRSLSVCFGVLGQTNMVNKRKKLFPLNLWAFLLKGSKIMEWIRGAVLEVPTEWWMSRSSPIFVSWDFCLIKGAIFSPQKLKGRASTALFQIIGAMGLGSNYLNQVMEKRLTTMLTIFHSWTFLPHDHFCSFWFAAKTLFSADYCFLMLFTVWEDFCL